MTEFGAVDDLFPDELAQLVTVTIAGVSQDIRGVFVDEYSTTQLFNGAVENASPSLTVRTSDVEGIGRGSSVIVDGLTYFVVEVRPDGAGVTTLILSKD
jgi:hypothetical protein